MRLWFVRLLALARSELHALCERFVNWHRSEWFDGYRQGCEDAIEIGRIEGRTAGFNFTRNMSVKAMQIWAEEFPEQASTGRRNFQTAAEKLGKMTESGWFPKFYG